MKKFMAFTLAETLIVMGIIGVVAALTLPNLNSTTGEKEKVARVKKYTAIYQMRMKELSLSMDLSMNGLKQIILQLYKQHVLENG